MINDYVEKFIDNLPEVGRCTDFLLSRNQNATELQTVIDRLSSNTLFHPLDNLPNTKNIETNIEKPVLIEYKSTDDELFEIIQKGEINKYIIWRENN